MPSLGLVTKATSSGTPASAGAPGHRPTSRAGTARGRSGRGHGGWHRRERRRPGSFRCARRCRNTGAARRRNATFLDKAGLIKRHHRLRIAQVLDDIGPQIVAYRIGIPAHAGQEVLHAVGGGSPAASARCQPFLRSSGASSPSDTPPPAAAARPDRTAAPAAPAGPPTRRPGRPSSIVAKASSSTASAPAGRPSDSSSPARIAPGWSIPARTRHSSAGSARVANSMMAPSSSA